MNTVDTLFESELHAINLGAPNFVDDLASQGCPVVPVKWQPPSIDASLLEALDRMSENLSIQEANEEAVRRIMTSQTMLTGVKRAIDVIPGMTQNTILHAGPPIAWENMCGPMQGAVIGALIFEGVAANENEARAQASSGNINFAPCHEYGAVGPMAGIISPSMPVHVVENKTFGNKAYCTVNEGLGKVLRFGAFDESVIERLRWLAEEFAPSLDLAIQRSGGIDTKTIIAQAVQMGDECHNRNKAATSLFFKEIVDALLDCELPPERVRKVLSFISSNDHYFLNLSMPSCKCSLDAASNIKGSTVVTAMARNGVEFGIKVSGLGDRWFTGPAQMVEGLLFPGFSEEDATPDLGDSAITETTGIGGFAMGASPAIVQFVGGSVADAIKYSKSMRSITVALNSGFALPPLDFSGTATGIDILKVLETGILPVINTGIAHRKAGVGQVGAGIVHPPFICFEKAFRALMEQN